MEKDKIVQTAQAKTDELEKLCRALQTEEDYKALDDQKCGSPDQSEEIHSTLSDDVGMSHDPEAASHDPHEDGSHDLVAKQTSPSSDVTANQNEVDIMD